MDQTNQPTLPLGCIVRLNISGLLKEKLTKLFPKSPLDASDVMGITEDVFRGLPSVGTACLADFQKLQVSLPQGVFHWQLAKKNLEKYALALARPILCAQTGRAVERLERSLDRLATPVDLLEIDFLQLAERKGWGPKYLQLLADLATAVQEEAVGWSEGAQRSTGWLEPSGHDSQSPQESDTLLAQALAPSQVLPRQKRAQQILESYCGIGQCGMTLEGAGSKFGLTRERIRQIKKSLLALRLDPIRKHLGVKQLNPENRRGKDLEQLLPRTRALFAQQKDFFAFLKALWGKDYDFISGFPEIKNHPPELRQLFDTKPPPYSHAEILVLLPKRLGNPEVYLQELVSQGLFVESGEGLEPRKLSITQAVHQVLLKYPEGLHWEKINACLSDEGSMFADTFHPRASMSCAVGSAYIYLCGRGTYRHTSFFPASAEACEGYVRQVLRFMKFEAENLRDLHHRSRLDEVIDYFFLRQCVLLEVERRDDLYFNGQSFVDTISRSKLKQNVGTCELVLRILGGSITPMHGNAILAELPFLSADQIQLNLPKLLAQGKVCRASPNTWTLSMAERRHQSGV